MLRQQRSQRVPSRFNDFVVVDLPPPRKRTVEEHTSEQHSSSPGGRHRKTPKVQRSKHVRKMTMDFFKSSAGPDRRGGVVTVESPLCPRRPVERASLEKQLSPPGSERAVGYVCPEEMASLSGPERIDYILKKRDQIRIQYASLKTEVASIDRKRKKMKKRRRREGSTTLASTSVSPGSSDSTSVSPCSSDSTSVSPGSSDMSSSPSQSTDTQII